MLANLTQTSKSSRLKNRQKSCQQVIYHKPYERLIRRIFFDRIFRQLFPEDVKIDYFVIFDALAKRGGYQEVTKNNRWQQIRLSLPYENSLMPMTQFYSEYIAPHQSEFLSRMPPYKVISKQFNEKHLLPSNPLTTSFYQPTQLEHLLCQQYFIFIDEYFTIKTICLFNPNTQKIPIEYFEKYLAVRKWMLLYGQTQFINTKEISLLGFGKSDENVTIIGMPLTALLMADKLTDFGIKVTIIYKTVKQPVIANGIIMMEGGEEEGSYLSYLRKSGIQVEELQLGLMGHINHDNVKESDEIIRKSEELFVSFLEEMKIEASTPKNTSKKLYDELNFYVSRKKLQSIRHLMKWHYYRYLMFNRFKGQSTTLADLMTYQTKKIIKHVVHKHIIGVVRSYDEIINRLKKKPGFTLIQSDIHRVDYDKGKWKTTIKKHNEKPYYLPSSQLVFAEQDVLSENLAQNQMRIPYLSYSQFSQGFQNLNQLITMKYFNCLYKFKEKVVFKDHIKNYLCISTSWTHGHISYFLLKEGYQVLAIFYCYPNMKVTNYYEDVYSILEARILQKGVNKLEQNKSISAYDFTFSMKDQRMMENLIKPRQQEKLFLLIPITSTNCPHKLQAEIDMCNYMCGDILIKAFPGLSVCDDYFKNMFLKDSHQRNSFFEKFFKDGTLGKLDTKQKSDQEPTLKAVQSVKLKTSQNANNKQDEKIIKVSQNKTEQKQKQPSDDYFGFEHPIIKSHLQFIKSKSFSNAENLDWNFVAHCASLDIEESLMLYPNLMLYSLGSPLIVQEPESLKESIIAEYHMISRLMYYSLDDLEKTTIYLQFTILFNSKLLYVIIDQNKSSFMFYHSSYQKLISKIHSRILQVRSYHKINTVVRAKFKRDPPNWMLPNFISKIILDEIKGFEGKNLDQILEQKIQKTLLRGQSSHLLNMMQEQQDENQTFSLAQTYLKCPYQFVYSEISYFLDQTLIRNNHVRIDLFSLFFGYLRQHWLICEIMRKQSENPLSTVNLQSLDSNLSSEVEKVICKSIVNEMGSVDFAFNQCQITFHRNFLRTEQGESTFEKYTYQKSLDYQDGKISCKHILVLKGVDQDFENQQQIMKHIIKILLRIYSPQQIIQSFKSLISSDIQNEQNLLPQLKLYYQMTRRVPIRNHQSALKKMEFEKMETKIKQNSLQLASENRIQLIDQQLFYVLV